MGFWFYLDMLRHPEVEMIVTKEEVYIHTSLETGGRARPLSPKGGSPWVIQESEAEC